VVGQARTQGADGVVQRVRDRGPVCGENPVDLLGDGDRVEVADRPQRADHVREPGQLQGSGQVDRLVRQAAAADRGLAGGQELRYGLAVEGRGRRSGE